MLSGRGQGVGQEVQRRHGSDEVAAGLASLSDEPVSAPCDGGARLSHVTDHHKDECARFAKVLDKPVPFAERQHDDVHAGVDADLDVVATGEGHQQV